MFNIIFLFVDPSPNQMSPVTCLAVHPDSSVLVSGHIDGTARLFNASNMKVLLKMIIDYCMVMLFSK